MSKDSSLQTYRSHSTNKDEIKALEEVYKGLKLNSTSITLLFISSHYNLDKLKNEISKWSGGTIIGCTSSGELSESGYNKHSISALSLCSERLQEQTFFIPNVSDFTLQSAEEITEKINTRLERFSQTSPKTKAFGLLLIDGLSVKEERVASNLHAANPKLSFFGGSAGDDLSFKKTFLLYNGEFHTNAAIFTCFFTDLPFEIFKTQHFKPVEESKMVITKADPTKRIVYEINGFPAAKEYARLVGVDQKELGPNIFSEYPVMLKIGGNYYVRSIMTANEDDSFTFYCAIEEGLVLILGRGNQITEKLDLHLKDITERIRPKVILACECILRRLEVENKNLVSDASKVMNKYNVVGFHTYGEQINGLHVNQTITGIAIGDEE